MPNNNSSSSQFKFTGYLDEQHVNGERTFSAKLIQVAATTLHVPGTIVLNVLHSLRPTGSTSNGPSSCDEQFGESTPGRYKVCVF